MNSFEEIMDFYPGNRFAYKKLLEQIREHNIVPFIGAGLSSCCYPKWDDLLTELLEYVSDSFAKEAESYIKIFDYYTAADKLCEGMGELLFYQCIRDKFNETIITEDKIKNQAIFLLPKFLFNVHITTNYDRVLEKAFEYNRVGFEIGFPYDTHKLVDFMKHDVPGTMIMKIHGDIRSNNDDLILTGKSYDLHYCDGANLKKHLSKWADSKNLLFLGASLYMDRAISLIANQMEEGMVNYTIFGVDSSEVDEIIERANNVNALPIFYNKEDHGNLTIILQHLLDDLKTD